MARYLLGRVLQTLLSMLVVVSIVFVLTRLSGNPVHLLLDANATGPYILMGKVLLKKDDPQQALLYLERANKMDSRNFITHHLMGQAYRALKNTEAAERELKLAEQLQSQQSPQLQSQ